MQVRKLIVPCFVSIIKHIESANTMLSFIWWTVGVYWVTLGGQSLTTDAPQLYWLVGICNHHAPLFALFCLAPFCNHLVCCVMQGLYCISFFRRFDCTDLCCCCMPYWYCCLLLSSMHPCSPVCSDRSGKYVFFLILDLVQRLCLDNKFLMPVHFQNGEMTFLNE